MYFHVQDINKALKEYRKKTDPQLNSIYGSHIFLDYQDKHPQMNSQEVMGILLSEQVDVLAQTDSLYAKMLRLYFLEKQKIAIIAPELGMSSAAYHRKRLDAVAELATIINAYEESIEHKWSQKFIQRLDQATVVKCFGIENNIQEIIQLLGDPDRPTIINLQGLGGIGKTTLANAVMRRVIARKLFEDYGWASARQPMNMSSDEDGNPIAIMETSELIESLTVQLLGQECLPIPFNLEKVVQMLAEHLQETPSLIVLDNLETVADPDVLWSILNRLCNPSCFILTSRNHIEVAYSIYPYIVPELDLENSLALIRYRAKQTNLPHIAEANDDTLLPIYKTVGGNPLALLLVVGQMHTMDLDYALNRLQLVKGSKIEDFYSYIYRQSWENLDFTTRQVLLSSLLLPDDGETRDFFTAISGVDPHAFDDALDTLINLNLVIHHPGPKSEPSRYTIHGLTATFLEGDEPTW